jgi:molybdopterin-guanine dinucleotide biosynthesis protein A
MHQKHAKLSKPFSGNYHASEWSFLGAPCGKIKSLVKEIYRHVQADYTAAYVDADHKTGDESIDLSFDNVLMDRINFYQFQTRIPSNEFDWKYWLSEMDLVFVNGNHFKASRQFVLLDPSKKDSLERKLDRLTQVDAFIALEPGSEIYPFLQHKLPGWENLPVFNAKEPEAIADFLKKELKAGEPELFGLILAGGKSTRMGVDKGGLLYHGVPQREYAAALVASHCKNVFLSGRPGQKEISTDAYPVIEDTYLGLGPYGGILSAMREYPDKAWLVMACDLPLVDDLVLKNLVQNRKPGKVATAFHNPETKFPDPLLTIWEPKAYPRMLQFLAQGYSCPRKVLINSNIKEIDSGDGKFLRNANTPEEAKLIKQLLDSGA